MRYAVVDVETAGLSFDHDEILEIAIVTVEGGAIQEQWVSLVRPTNPVSLRATKIHGIDNDLLMTAPRKELVAREARSRLGGAIIVEHSQNGFDSKFLARFLGAEPWRGSMSTLNMARSLYPKLGKYDLPAVCSHLGVELNAQHQAASDALATAKILVRMLEAGFDGWPTR